MSKEHLALHREWSVAERSSQVGDAVESRGQHLVLGVLCLGGREIRQSRGQGLVVVAQFLDASRNQAGLDPVLERVHLELEAAVGVGELLPDLRRPELAVAPALATMVSRGERLARSSTNGRGGLTSILGTGGCRNSFRMPPSTPRR